MMIDTFRLRVLCLMIVYSICAVTSFSSKGFIAHPGRKSSGTYEIPANQMVTKSNLKTVNECMVSIRNFLTYEISLNTN